MLINQKVNGKVLAYGQIFKILKRFLANSQFNFTFYLFQWLIFPGCLFQVHQAHAHARPWFPRIRLVFDVCKIHFQMFLMLCKHHNKIKNYQQNYLKTCGKTTLPKLCNNKWKKLPRRTKIGSLTSELRFNLKKNKVIKPKRNWWAWKF